MIVTIERISQGDKSSLRQWRNEPAVSKWMYTNHEIGEDEHSAWFDNMLADSSKAVSYTHLTLPTKRIV